MKMFTSIFYPNAPEKTAMASFFIVFFKKKNSTKKCRQTAQLGAASKAHQQIPTKKSSPHTEGIHHQLQEMTEADNGKSKRDAFRKIT